MVVCCHDEERQIENFARLLAPSLQAAEDSGCSVEVVAVNHGSVDRTGKILDALAQIDRRWRVVHLKRTRESKKEALEAGISICRGEVLVLLDADCQPMQSSWLLELTAGAKANWDIQVGTGMVGNRAKNLSFLLLVAPAWWSAVTMREHKSRTLPVV